MEHVVVVKGHKIKDFWGQKGHNNPFKEQNLATQEFIQFHKRNYLQKHKRKHIEHQT